MSLNVDRDVQVTLALLTAAAVILLVTLGVAVGLSAASDTMEFGADHELATNDSVTEYEESGFTAGKLDPLDLRVSVSQTHSKAGIDGLQYTDVDTHWLRIQYNESIERTVSFYVPSDVWYPRPKDDLESVSGNAQVSLQPVENDSYTEVTIQLSGKTDAVFPVSKEAGVVFRVRDEARSNIERITGVDLPEFGGGADWNTLPSDALTGDNSTAVINTDGADKVLVQYDAANDSTRSWVPLPRCSASEAAPVCEYENGNETRIGVLSRTDSPPDVRYKRGGDVIAQLQGIVNEVAQIPQRLSEKLPSVNEVLFLYP